MPRRKKKNNSLLIYIVTAIVIFLIWIAYLNWVFQSKIVNKIPNSLLTWTSLTWSNTEEKHFYANSIVSGTGKLFLIPYDIKVWTKYKLKYDNYDFFVKSDKYVLDNYVDQDIYFSWEVIWFATDNSPVLNIINIKWTNENLSGDQLTWEEENKIYKLNELELDLTNSDYTAILSGASLIVYKTGDVLTGWNLSGEILTWGNLEKLLEIDEFKCEKWNYLYDCDAIKQQAKTFKFEKLISNNWVVFYKLPETDQYVVLGKNYGYNIFPQNSNIYPFLDYIKLTENSSDQNNIEKATYSVDDIIKNTCKKDDLSLVSIEKMFKEWDNIYNVLWLDKYWNKVYCIVEINWDNTKIAKLKSMWFVKDNLEIKWNLIEDNSIDENKYLIYKSRAYGYILYMPKSVKYKSILIKNSLGIAGLNCIQQVNIADWKTGNLDDPELKVLYCKTDLNIDTLNKLLQTNRTNYVIKDVNGKKFIILYKDSDIAKKILNNLIIK